ncbi:hypothetical protein PanWU01x14_167720 [Parasponia andersonii]|uniref:Uncharacterized protein n=1 Tax=Parasponia andersonii TaxID=3476 RepID=A0A2P5CAV4_PARAD|nr:hypothetical protein PanWU01x14_167720 [Parasponia andersonii]
MHRWIVNCDSIIQLGLVFRNQRGEIVVTDAQGGLGMNHLGLVEALVTRLWDFGGKRCLTMAYYNGVIIAFGILKLN